jgi:hypothetical protein
MLTKKNKYYSLVIICLPAPPYLPSARVAADKADVFVRMLVHWRHGRKMLMFTSRASIADNTTSPVTTEKFLPRRLPR